MITSLSRLEPLVDIANLHVDFAGTTVVSGLDLQLRSGQCVALVGESGSGKSVTARTLVGLAGPRARIKGRRLRVAGQDLTTLSAAGWQALRGRQIGFVMQDALGSLDPLRKVGWQLERPLRLHAPATAAEHRQRVLELLRDVGVPQGEVRAAQYPWQLSGGLRQRALIAAAIACGPRLLIADEPTTALDASVQAQILTLLERLRGDDNALLIVSHDLAVVSRLADRVVVMHHGVVVEEGSTEQILRDPRQPYTQRLLRAARAVHFQQTARGVTKLFAAPDTAVVLETRGLSKAYTGPDGLSRTVLQDVALRLHAGRTLGVVGESGSGKTTLLRLLIGIEEPDSGDVWLAGRRWAGLSAAEQRLARRGIAVVFQDPQASFDPRYTVVRVLAEALAAAGVARSLRRHRAGELLAQVQLPAILLDRRPLELSGGQRQRLAIARALAGNPRVLVCDEPVSALDVTVQAHILQMIEGLKGRLGLACLFISHDLGVIERVSDEVLVLKDGEVVERGPTAAVLRAPQHPYTRTLLAAVPVLPAALPAWFERLAV